MSPCRSLCPPPPPSLPPLTQVSAKIDEAKAASEAIRSDIAVLNTRLDRIKAAREAEQAKLNEIITGQQEARADIPALNVEKKELWEVRLPRWGDAEVCGGALMSPRACGLLAATSRSLVCCARSCRGCAAVLCCPEPCVCVCCCR